MASIRRIRRPLAAWGAAPPSGAGRDPAEVEIWQIAALDCHRDGAASRRRIGAILAFMAAGYIRIGGQNFGFAIENRDDLELARRIMESDALNQTTMRYEKHAEHLMLAWRVGDTPTREQMAAAAQGALKTLGMEDAKAFWVARRDEDRAHLLIVASKIHPETGRAYHLNQITSSCPNGRTNTSVTMAASFVCDGTKLTDSATR